MHRKAILGDHMASAGPINPRSASSSPRDCTSVLAWEMSSSVCTICATLVACATDGATDGATPDDAAENTQDVGADSAVPTQDVDTDSAAPGNNAEADVAVEEDVPAPIEVAATLRVVDPATGNGSANVTVTAGDDGVVAGTAIEGVDASATV